MHLLVCDYIRNSIYLTIMKLLKLLYIVYAGIVLLVLTFVTLLLVLFTFWMPSPKRGNAIYFIVRCVVDIMMLMLGIRHSILYEAPHDKRKPSVFVFNHISYLDAFIILMAIRNQNIRGLGKYEISKIPLFGFIYSSAVIMVKRSDKNDRARCVADLKEAIDNNISIVLAPEGTFNETSQPLLNFYDGAFRIAIETKTPIKPLLFLDAYERLHFGSAFSLTPGKSRIVYLEEIPVEGLGLDDVTLLKEKVYNAMDVALRKYKAKWIQ